MIKVVIAYGDSRADYLIKMFKKERKYRVVAITPDKNTAKQLSKDNKMTVYCGDPTKIFVLEDANINNCDIFISLSEDECANFVACLLAKKIVNAKKVICTVKNPRNVEVFKALGVDVPICSTYNLAQLIKNEASLETLFKTLSIEDEKISITEVVVSPDSEIVNKAVMDIGFPNTVNISAIFRDPNVLIPRGATIIKPNDKLILVSAPSETEAIMKFIKRNKK